jgi:hypothetical protein
MYKTLSIYDGIFFKVFIGHGEKKLKSLSERLKILTLSKFLAQLGIMLLAIPF